MKSYEVSGQMLDTAVSQIAEILYLTEEAKLETMFIIPLKVRFDRKKGYQNKMWLFEGYDIKIKSNVSLELGRILEVKMPNELLFTSNYMGAHK
jgi:hypothetical protein